MLGRDSNGGRDLVRGGPHRPCVPAVVRAAPRRRSRGRPARDPCLRSRGREGDVVRCLRNHRLRLSRVLSLGDALCDSDRNGESWRRRRRASQPRPRAASRPGSLLSDRASLARSRGRDSRPRGRGAPCAADDSVRQCLFLRDRGRRGAPSAPRCEVPPSPAARAGARGPRQAVRPFCALPAAPNCSRSPPGCGVPEPGGAGPVSGRGHSARRRSPAASGRSPPPPHVGRRGQQTWR